MIVCPCIDFCNIDRHSGSVEADHLVTRRMNEAYKMRHDCYLHGELNSGVTGESRGSQWNEEIFGLYRAVCRPKFTPSISVIRGKSGNPNFP